jgi:hypothetical protein
MTRLWALAENARRGQEADLGCPEPQARASVIVGSQRHLRLPLSDSACGGRSDTTPPQDHSQKSAGQMQCQRQAIRALWKFFYGNSG